MKSITAQELNAIKDGWSFNFHEKVDWQYEEIDQFFVKHDVTAYTFVFKNPEDKKYYSGTYSQSYNYGMNEYDIDLDEVRPVEVKSIEWQKV